MVLVFLSMGQADDVDCGLLDVDVVEGVVGGSVEGTFA